MNTAEIKLQLFRKIDELKDKQLEEVYEQLLSLLNASEEESLSQEKMDVMLAESEKDIEQDNVVSHQFVKKEIINWRSSRKK